MISGPSFFFIPARRVARALFLALLCALLSFTVSAADATSDDGKTLRVAYVEFPPITYRNSAGEPMGEMVGVLDKLAAEAGYRIEYLYLPVARAYLYLKNGTIDMMMGLTKVPAVQHDVLESWVNPVSMQLSAWYLDATEPIDHLDRLRNKTVILINGYTYGGLRNWLIAQPDIRVSEAPNHRSALDMLKLGRGDYLLDYRKPIRQVMADPGYNMIRESPIRTRHGAWLFSLANPRAALLREEFDDAYLRLAEKGEVAPVQRYPNTYVVPGFPLQYR